MRYEIPKGVNMINDTIREYLINKGRMSRQDIIDDCDVDNHRVTFAHMDCAIVSVAPAPGGVGEWFAAAVAK